MLSWAEVDLGIIKNNIAKIKKLTGPEVKFGAVVKANAYGHGLLEVSRAALEAEADYLIVDDCNEALFLREKFAEIPILIIGAVEKNQLFDIVSSNIEISLFDLNLASQLSLLALRKNKKAKIHLKIDTGMHRLGFKPEEAIKVIEALDNYPNLEIVGIYTHFASAASDREYTQKQLKDFSNFLFYLQKRNRLISFIHAANSGATLLDSQAHFSMVRVGIAMYGCSPFDFKQKSLWQRFNLEPVLSFKTKIVQVKKVAKGEVVGYGGTHKIIKDTKIATIVVGYADGYDRDFSNNAWVLVGGVRCPVVGRICMRMSMVDVSKALNVKVGDEVVLIGKQGKDQIFAEDLAEWKKSNVHEIITRIPSSVPRVYK